MLSNNEQKERKSRITALAGTLVFHASLLGVLVFLAFHTILPLPAEEGVEINFDYTNPVTVIQKPEILQSAFVIDTKADHVKAKKDTGTEIPEKQNNTSKKNGIKPNKSKSLISIVETPDESTLINRKPNEVSDKKTTSKNKPSPSGKSGDMDNPEEKSESLIHEGNGISFDLGGRGARNLPKPASNSNESGKIVVSIKVNREGKVIYAGAGAKSTTITDNKLSRQAESTARKTLFAPDPNAPEEQRGTITYILGKQK